MSDVINLEFFRKQAKIILKRCRGGDSVSIERVRSQVPGLSADQIKLAHVHHALALEKGFKSWGELKRYDAPVGRFLVAVRGGSIKSAQRELERFPDLLEESIHVSCAVGDADAVRYHLELDPTLLNAEADGWNPLLYACGSPFHRLNARHAAGIVESVAVLLDHGADPNQSSAVYRASMNGNRSLAALLFQRGAAPVRASGTPSLVKAGFWDIPRDEGPMDRTLAELFSDPAAVQEMTTQMEAMRTQYGAWFKKLRGERMLPRDCYEPVFPANEPYIAMIWKRLIEWGVHPNWHDMCQDTPLHYLAVWGRNPDQVGFFLAHGANPNIRRADGKTPYFLAVRAGNVAIADVLRAYGANTAEVCPMDELIGACARVNANAVKNVLDVHPQAFKTALPEDYEVLIEACAKDRFEQVELMLDSGFDPGGLGETGATALHAAAWHGRVKISRLLLDRGAPFNTRDRTFRGSPLWWAAHGSKNCRDADDDYCMIVEMLLDAGADPTSSNRWAVGPVNVATTRVATLIR